ncbi:hypothetical protein AB8879_11745 [Alphaproteobacteria bacterium LSUCC0744]
MTFSKAGIFGLLSLLLVGCSGTGTSDYTFVAPVIDNDQKGKVFVRRETGFAQLVVYDVNLNGTKVGELGSGEMLVANANVGKNFLQIKPTGMSSIGLNSPMSEFSNDGNQNNFFILGAKMGMLKNEITMLETTEDSWKKQSQ